MSELNSYQIEIFGVGQTKGKWIRDGELWTGDTWQKAIQDWIDEWNYYFDTSYQVISENPSADGRSGIMEIQGNIPPKKWVSGEGQSNPTRRLTAHRSAQKT